MRLIKIILSPNNTLAFFKKRRLLEKFSKKKLSIGDQVWIQETKFGLYNYLGDNVKIGYSSMGDFSYINHSSQVANADIGKYCSIASKVSIGLGEHPTNLVSTHGAFYSKNKNFKTFADKEYFDEYDRITIGNDVWIGTGCLITNGTKIGDGAIIAAGAVVTKDVEPYSIVGGVPARHIKMRFSDEIIRKLLDTQWWDIDYRIIEKNYLLMHDVEGFIDFVSKLKRKGK